LTRLVALRGRAFPTGRADGLAQVYAPGSALLRADQAALADLRSRHVTARGLGHRVLAARASAAGDDEVVLSVTEQLSSYTLVDPRGVVVERHTAGPVQQARVLLERVGVGWRLREVRPGP
jgi:hypothetical protein